MVLTFSSSMAVSLKMETAFQQNAVLYILLTLSLR